MFVVEGKLALEAVLASPYPLRSVLVLRRRLEALEGLALPAGLPVYAVDDDVMAATTGLQRPPWSARPGRPAAGPSPEELLAHLASPVVMVVEGVNDQENLGAIFRNAAAFGAGAVLLDPTCADPLYRRSVRVSLGHVLRVPFARLAPWPASLELVRKGGFVLLALTPSPRAERIEAVAAELQGCPGRTRRRRRRAAA